MLNREAIGFALHRFTVGDAGGEVGRGVFYLRNGDGINGGAVGDLSTGAAAVVHDVQQIVDIAPAIRRRTVTGGREIRVRCLGILLSVLPIVLRRLIRLGLLILRRVRLIRCIRFVRRIIFLILAVIGAVHTRDAVAVIQHLTLREQHTGRRVGLLLGCVADLQLRHTQRRGQTKKQGNSGLYDASQPFFHVSRSSCKRHRKGAVFHLPLLAGITFLSSVWHAAWR